MTKHCNGRMLTADFGSRLFLCLIFIFAVVGCKNDRDSGARDAEGDQQAAVKDESSQKEHSDSEPSSKNQSTDADTPGAVEADAVALRDQLEAALRASNFDLAQQLVEKGADVNLPNAKKQGEHQGARLIHTVCNTFSERYDDNLKVLKFLVDNDADVNALNTHGWPAIAEAIWGGDMELAKFLNQHQADLKMKMPGPWPDNTKNFTLLHVAAMKLRLEPVAWLLEQGLDANAQTDNGETPLMYAASGARTAIVQHLLENGANKNLTNARNETALDQAMQSLEDFENDPVNRLPIEQTIELLKQNSHGQK